MVIALTDRHGRLYFQSGDNHKACSIACGQPRNWLLSSIRSFQNRPLELVILFLRLTSTFVHQWISWTSCMERLWSVLWIVTSVNKFNQLTHRISNKLDAHPACWGQKPCFMECSVCRSGGCCGAYNLKANFVGIYSSRKRHPWSCVYTQNIAARSHRPLPLSRFGFWSEVAMVNVWNPRVW